MGGVCLLALVPLWMPRAWIVAGHRWLGWGPFPDGPVAEYLARSVSALSAFYGGRGDDTLTGGAGNDTFVIEAASGHDHITDFANHEVIRFSGVSGVDDFGDLTLTKVGNDTLITWGTSDSLTVEGYKPNQLHASDFEFVASASSAVAQLFSKEVDLGSLHGQSSVADALALGSSFGAHGAFGGDAFDHGMATLAMQAHI